MIETTANALASIICVIAESFLAVAMFGAKYIAQITSSQSFQNASFA